MTKLAIDSGQTGIKVRAGSASATYPGIRTNVPLFPQLAEVIQAAAGQFGITPDQVAIGTTGLTAVEADPAELLASLIPAGVRSVVLAHDSVTSFLGAMGYQHGVVSAAGTGVVTLGVGPLGHSRVDGWGNLIGDAGSGYWIGRLGLDQVMRAFDGRGPATALTEVVTREFPALEDAYIKLQTDPDRVRRIAGFAKAVARLADHDEVCAQVCAQAGTELACSAAAAVANVGLDSPRISLIGGVFKAEPIMRACVSKLTERWPGFQPYPAHGDGLDGVEALFDLPAEHPLAELVRVAR
ncbi:MAG: ATPase [Propionibacteriaceae bacterium]|jgi:N-acetylglucosamine kinase-like BadF-type ATPase|nr:ATPase [Propionibacteriaceae bacterium]